MPLSVGAVEGAGRGRRPRLHVPLGLRSLVVLSREVRREAIPAVKPASELVGGRLRVAPRGCVAMRNLPSLK